MRSRSRKLSWLLAVLLAFLGVGGLRATIVVDAAGTSLAGSSTGFTLPSFSTGSNSNLMLLTWANVSDGAASDTVTAVTANGANMTLVGFTNTVASGGGFNYTSLWSLTNPAASTSFSIVGTFSLGTGHGFMAGACSLGGVNNPSPWGIPSYEHRMAGAGAFGCTVTTQYANSWLINNFFLNADPGATIVQDSTFTNIFNISVGTLNISNGAYKQAGNAGQYSVQNNYTGSYLDGINILVELVEANYPTFTPTNTPTFTISQTFTASPTVTATPTFSASPTATPTFTPAICSMANAMVADYQFNCGNVTADSSGNGNTLTQVGTVPCGTYPQAYPYIDSVGPFSSSNWFVVPAASQIQNMSSWTVSFWYNYTSNARQQFLTLYDSGSNYIELFNNSGSFSTQSNLTSQITKLIGSGSPDNRYHFLTAQFTSGVLTMRDGTSSSSGAFSYNAFTAAQMGLGYGIGYAGAVTSNLADFRIYSCALTAAQIAQLYNVGMPAYNTLNLTVPQL